MQECEAGTGKGIYVKRVTVRSGGAGHAHSGIIKGDPALTEPESAKLPKRADGKIVRLGR
jgi:hypothetical protein